MHGTYIGNEEQFQGRSAILRGCDQDVVQAQFDEGKTWETHSWITFLKSDWYIDEDTSQVQE